MPTDPWAAFNPQPAQGAVPGSPATGAPRSIPGTGPKAPAPPSGYRQTTGGNLEAIPGGPADPTANLVDTPGDISKTGDDYLATLPPGVAGQVRALSEGRRAFPTGTALKDPKVQELIAAATQYDPTLDAANAATRVSTRKNFTSGKARQNITAINTAIGHLGTLKEKAEGLGNRSFPLWNTVANAAETATGDPRVKEFGIARDAVANELMRVFRQVGASTSEIDDWKDTISSSDSPEQLHKEIGTAVELLNSRLQAMQDEYQTGLGQTADVYQYLTPHAKQVLNTLAPGTIPVDGAPPAAAAAGTPGGSPPPGPDGNPPEQPFSPGDPGYTPATETRTVADRPDLVAEYRQRLSDGQDPHEILTWLRDQGVQPGTLVQAMQQLAYRKKHPEVPIDRYSITSTKEVPLTTYEKAITEVGSGGAGAAALGAADMLSGSTLDNLSSDPERARLALQVSQTANPTEYAGGTLAGGLLASLGGEAGLARAGMSPGLVRGLLADVGMGSAVGAGSADEGSRIAGAAKGGLSAAAGSLAGAGVMKGAGKALAPTGGRLAKLYDAGVRPTPGQRFADSGTAGGILNAAEEHLQSVPIVGTAIRGARQEARDQFQVGAFNDALKEIGEELPKGVKPGTDPHKYAQQAFGKVYDQARSGMTMVADQQLSNDLGQLAPDISTLGPQMKGKLKSIMQNSVNSKLRNGQLSGDAYKVAVSDLGKHISRLRGGTMGEEHHLADVLEGVQSALDASARRNSHPDAVSLLDAADAGYAKLVRIEDAAARRGGEPGTFSPSHLDAAVQKTSGGVRSKAYLRGEAAMQDYATQGRSLQDRVPNSGTPERQMAGAIAVGGAGYMAPSALAALGAIGAAYAPGVRKVMKGAFAPAGPTRKAIALQLEKRARLAGRASATIAAEPSPETTPSP